MSDTDGPQSHNAQWYADLNEVAELLCCAYVDLYTRCLGALGSLTNVLSQSNKKMWPYQAINNSVVPKGTPGNRKPEVPVPSVGNTLRSLGVPPAQISQSWDHKHLFQVLCCHILLALLLHSPQSQPLLGKPPAIHGLSGALPHHLYALRPDRK